MSEPEIDAERLAALLDGRLDGATRAEVLARLAASEDAAAELAAAAAVLRELEEAGELPAALPRAEAARSAAPSPRHRWTTARRWLAAAAVLLVTVAGWWLWSRGRAPTLVAPAELATLVLAEGRGKSATPSPAVPTRTIEPVWTATRGAADLLSPSARAVRLGARLMELELAARTRDTATARLAADAATLLGGIPGATPVASVYRRVRERAGEPPHQLAPLLADGWAATLRIVDADLAHLGAWLAAARVAASRRDAAFFRAAASRQALARGQALRGLEPDARTRLGRIEAATRTSPPDWEVLVRELAASLGELGS